MKKIFFFLIPILVITSLYFVIRFIIDAIIEMDEVDFGE